ncbi:MAG: 3-dehydrosphinganine reductase [Trizodia sp. TS-e1964]|nr:MAG: 3-dehydrosphinganine reductase [Trizodia sp. TS-e1964]
MGFFNWKNYFPVDGRTVLITGGSQGMGKAVAKLLAEKGANVVIVARDVKKLEHALQYISAAAASPSTQRFHFISADVTIASEATRIISEVTEWNNNKAPDIVWCIAGSARPGFFLDTDTEILKQQMDVNYFSAAFMAHAILKSWLSPANSTSLNMAGKARPSEPRHLIFTSSVVAFYTILGYSPYAPAKSALRSLSDTLYQELQLYHASGVLPQVKIHTVFPGEILSPGLVQENLTKPAITKKLEEDDKGQTEDQVAASSIRSLENGEYLITTGFLGRVLKSCAWGGSPKNNWLLDTFMNGLISLVWPFAQLDINHKIRSHGRKNGHPETYKTET